MERVRTRDETAIWTDQNPAALSAEELLARLPWWFERVDSRRGLIASVLREIDVELNALARIAVTLGFRAQECVHSLHTERSTILASADQIAVRRSEMRHQQGVDTLAAFERAGVAVRVRWDGLAALRDRTALLLGSSQLLNGLDAWFAAEATERES